VGYSGMGSYHGKKSFSTFTHEKSVLKRSNRIDLDFRYHPYTERKKKLIKFFIK
jgi:aldehyde dehydrogenase (NAD+)